MRRDQWALAYSLPLEGRYSAGTMAEKLKTDGERRGRSSLETDCSSTFANKKGVSEKIGGVRAKTNKKTNKKDCVPFQCITARQGPMAAGDGALGGTITLRNKGVGGEEEEGGGVWHPTCHSAALQGVLRAP